MKSMKIVKKAQSGFTLIELMIVVAIIGILAAVAIPAYKDYTIKSKWASNLTYLTGVKRAIQFCLNENGQQGGSCDSQAELALYGYAGSALPTPKYATGPLTLTGADGAVTILFTGTADVKDAVYSAKCEMNATDGNILCTKTAADTLNTGGNNFIKGDLR
jgi:type IV pilus assembly protein PilA